MAGALFAGAGLAGLALLAGCQLVLDFSPLADAALPDSGGVPDSAPPDAADLCGQLEPNDALAQALAIEPGTFMAAICPGGDADFYRFELDGKQDFAAEVSFVLGDNDLELELYNVDSGMLITISTGLDENERIERSLAVSGRLPLGNYAVRVFGRDAEVQNDYQLVWERGVLTGAGP